MNKKKIGDPMLVLATFPDGEVARQIGAELVETQVAACVNLLPGAISLYRWQGQIHEDQEVLALIKTTRGRVADLRDALVRLHPYEVPEFLVIEVADGWPPYLEWMADMTSGGLGRPGTGDP